LPVSIHSEESSLATRLITVSKDEEVLETLQRAVAEAGIQHASMSLIGAIHECTVSVMRKCDALDDLLREYDQPFELTGTGEVVDGKAHVHVVLGGEDVTVAGHLHRALVRDFFVHAYVTEVSAG
jgi:predicted DNA-binding protein with PD1-like motif